MSAVRRDSGNKIAVSAHGMGSGGLAVDAMAIGCLGVERRVERFFSYLAILKPGLVGPVPGPLGTAISQYHTQRVFAGAQCDFIIMIIKVSVGSTHAHE